MPWITAHVPSSAVSEASASDLADAIAIAAATVCGLQTNDVIVLVSRAELGGAAGAKAVVTGRDRGPDVEAALARGITDVLAHFVGCDSGFVAVTRDGN